MLVYQSPVARATPFDNQTNGFNALNTQTAIEEATLLALFGAGSDGDVALSSGTTNLTRTMYYNTLTLSGTAVLNTNGYKIFCKVSCSVLDNAVIQNNGSNGTNAVTTTPGVGGTAAPGVDLGAATSGTSGTTTAQPGNPTSITGYGGSGGGGGDGGGTTNNSTGGVVTNIPEHIIRHDHLYSGLNIKQAGAGGSGGIGGAQPLFATRGAGGGGGGGGGVVFIFAKTLGNSSTIGIRALGGNGGNGANASGGNGGGGGGGAGGGGGFIYIVSLDIVIGNISVSGGTGGTGGTAGTGTRSGVAGTAGAAGSIGHTAIYNGRLGSWTVT